MAFNAPLLSKVSSLLIQGKRDWVRPRGNNPGNGGSYSYEALKEILRQATSLFSLRLVEDSWGDDENVRRVIVETRGQVVPLKELRVVIVQCNDEDDEDFLTNNVDCLTILSI